MGRYLEIARQTMPLSTESKEVNTYINPGSPSSLSNPTKQTNLTKEGPADLEASRQRLEKAGVCVAVFEDGSMRVVITENETVQAIDHGGVVYSPADMYHFVKLDERERRMLHDFKRRFGGTVEWSQ